MGLGKLLHSAIGTPSKDLLEHGVLARADVLGATATGTTIAYGTGNQAALQEQVFEFQLRVWMDDTDPYEVTIRQRLPLMQANQLLQAGGVSVAVRVDPTDHQQVAMDLHTPPPAVVTKAAFSLADVLAHGAPCRVVVTVDNGRTGLKSPAGLDVYSVVVTVLQEGQAPRTQEFANTVPEAAVPLLYPGSKLPAKILDGHIAVDWDAALAEAAA